MCVAVTWFCVFTPISISPTTNTMFVFYFCTHSTDTYPFIDTWNICSEFPSYLPYRSRQRERNSWKTFFPCECVCVCVRLPDWFYFIFNIYCSIRHRSVKTCFLVPYYSVISHCKAFPKTPHTKTRPTFAYRDECVCDSIKSVIVTGFVCKIGPLWKTGH